MQIVAGISLKNLKPRVWDPSSEYYLPSLNAIMVSYAEFHQMRARRRQAVEVGLRVLLGVPDTTKIFLDNGAFFFRERDENADYHEYLAFVAGAKPDWYPIPRDFIPTPRMTRADQLRCLMRTMEVNHAYSHDGFVPIVHVSSVLDQYITQFKRDPQLTSKPEIALGGIVPNLLRTPKAAPYNSIVANVRQVRAEFPRQSIHLFGVGGTATLHLAMLLGMDSVDSSGWRNRAARGIVQLGGGGDRIVAELGSWRGRAPSDAEWWRLEACHCPACQQHGLQGLRANGTFGFSNRAAHNLWILLQEQELIERHFADGTYAEWLPGHLDNTIYRPLIEQALKSRDRCSH